MHHFEHLKIEIEKFSVSDTLRLFAENPGLSNAAPPPAGPRKNERYVFLKAEQTGGTGASTLPISLPIQGDATQISRISAGPVNVGVSFDGNEAQRLEVTPTLTRRYLDVAMSKIELGVEATF